MKLFIAYFLLVLAKNFIVCQRPTKYVVLCENPNTKHLKYPDYTNDCLIEKNITLNAPC